MNKKQLLKSKVGLFSERETTNEALEYALSLIPSNPSAVTTAIMVYHNTLIQALADQLPDEPVPLGGRRVKDPSKCKIESKGECGCAFGQCENGLIY